MLAVRELPSGAESTTNVPASTPAGREKSRKGLKVAKYSTPSHVASLPLASVTIHWNVMVENQ